MNNDSAHYNQHESIAARYLNHFAIQEDDQFEVAAIQTLDYEDQNEVFEKVDKAMKAIENLQKKHNQGSDYFFKIQKNHIDVI